MKRIKYLFTLVLLVLLLSNCVALNKQEIPFVVVTEGDKAAGYIDQRGLVIASQDEWEEVWEQIHLHTSPRPTLPAVDLTQYILLGVFAGEKQSGGYTIQVTKVTQTDQAAIVYATETAPKAGQMVITQITYPYQIVRIPRTSLPVRFDLKGG